MVRVIYEVFLEIIFLKDDFTVWSNNLRKIVRKPVNLGNILQRFFAIFRKTTTTTYEKFVKQHCLSTYRVYNHLRLMQFIIYTHGL